jgi:hypothetical protein
MKKYEVIKPFRIDFTKIEKPPKIKQSTMFERDKSARRLNPHNSSQVTNNKTNNSFTKPLPNKDSTKKNK